MPTIEHAITLAADAHFKQIDKCGDPYIFHPLRVMMQFPTNETELCQIAVLHDVLEDSDFRIGDLTADGYSENVIAALDALHHHKNEPYMDYIKRVAENPLAKRVKLADIHDNSSPGRLARLDIETRTRLVKKYTQALDYLYSL